jgi:hypothetical protein
MIPWAGIAPRRTTQHNYHYVELCCVAHQTRRSARAVLLGPVAPLSGGTKPPAAVLKPHAPQCAGRAAKTRCASLGGIKAADRPASLASLRLHFDTHL